MCEEETSTTTATATATTPASDDEITSTINNYNNNNNNNNNNSNDTTTAATTSSDTAQPESPECGPNINLNRTITELLKPGKIEEVVAEIRTKLSMKKQNLSAVKRTKISAPNEKQSSKNLGYFNISFFGIFFSLVILSDCPKVFRDIRSAVRNIWSGLS